MADEQPIPLGLLTRPQLQHICKINNVKANLKTDALLKQLEDLGTKLHRTPSDHLPGAAVADSADEDLGNRSSAPPTQPSPPTTNSGVLPRRTRSRQLASESEPDFPEAPVPPAQRQSALPRPVTRTGTRSRGVSYVVSNEPTISVIPEVMESEKENEKEPGARKRAKDSQKRLGVGRPRVAGGGGARQVTRVGPNRSGGRTVTLQVDGKSFIPGAITPQGSEILDDGDETDIPIAGPSRRAVPGKVSTTRLADVESQVSKLLATNATIVAKLSSLEKTSISTRDDLNTQRERVDESKRNVLELRRELAGADGMSAAGRIAEGEERIAGLERTQESVNGRFEELEKKWDEERERRIFAESRVEKLEELVNELMERFASQNHLHSPIPTLQDPPDEPSSTLGKRTREDIEATPSSDMSFSFFDNPLSINKKVRLDSPGKTPKTPPPANARGVRPPAPPEIGQTGSAPTKPAGIKPGSSNVFKLPQPSVRPPHQAPTSPTLESPRRGAARAAKMKGQARLGAGPGPTIPATSLIDTLADDNEFPSFGIPPTPAPPFGTTAATGLGAGLAHPASPFSFADHAVSNFLLPPFAPYPMSRTLSSTDPALYPPLAVPPTPEPRDEREREARKARERERERERALREDGPPPSPGKRTMYGSELETLGGRFGDYGTWD